MVEEPRPGRAHFWLGRSGAIVLTGALTGGCAGKSVRPAGDGEGGTSGVGGAHGQSVALLQLPAGIDRVDLLVVVDNSLHMLEKQELLSEALPVLIDRLTAPACVDENGDVAAPGGVGCPPGSTRQFHPVTDIHVGVVTSSLGSQGGNQCTDDSENDYGELLGVRRAGLTSWNDAGFLSWDPGARHAPPGESNAAAFVDAVRAHVESSGATGCGYESSLEAWYRFLVDSEPVASVSNDGVFTVRGEVNATVLAQREMFLRPDSAVIIVMLSDENDCSILAEDGAQGWLTAYTGPSQTPFDMPRASSACAEDPNDPCCRLCLSTPAAGCPDDESDPECRHGEQLNAFEDHPNLRCFKQMQRFGVDLLYPTSRYVEALTERALNDRHGNVVENPLFAVRNGTPARDRSKVMLVGIVGVPWLDLSDPNEANTRALRLFTAEQLAQPEGALMGRSRWDLMLGSPGNYPPMDPFMLEQIEPRAEGTQHPLLGGPDYAIGGAQSAVRNLVNGHEQHVEEGDDLQYACIFPLRQPVPCDPPAAEGNDLACECNSSEHEYGRPTCSYPNGANTEGVQVYGKAYPGARQLEVLRGIGSQAVVGSICPKNTVPNGSPEDDPDYGYNPIVHAVAERLERIADAGCLALEVPVGDDGSIACRVVEAFASDSCSCDRPRQYSLEDASVAGRVRSLLSSNGQCGAESGVACDSLCFCEIEQLRGSEALSCAMGDELEGGFCHVEAGPLVAACPPDRRRILRVVGEPRAGATRNLVCEG